jgi:hypothetical protein
MDIIYRMMTLVEKSFYVVTNIEDLLVYSIISVILHINTSTRSRWHVSTACLRSVLGDEQWGEVLQF